jgi:hypothetical protein
MRLYKFNLMTELKVTLRQEDIRETWYRGFGQSFETTMFLQLTQKISAVPIEENY